MKVGCVFFVGTRAQWIANAIPRPHLVLPDRRERLAERYVDRRIWIECRAGWPFGVPVI